MDIYEVAAAARHEAAATVGLLSRETLEQRYLEHVEALTIAKESRYNLGRDIVTLVEACRNAPDEHVQLRYLQAFLYSFRPSDYDQLVARLRGENEALRSQLQQGVLSGAAVTASGGPISAISKPKSASAFPRA